MTSLRQQLWRSGMLVVLLLSVVLWVGGRWALRGALTDLVGSRLEHDAETLLAAKDAEHSGETRDVVYETADLWFHSMVMLSRLGLGPKDILDELASRFDLSGLEEKASRNK